MANSDEHNNLGGKANALLKLQKLGQPVPAFVVISEEDNNSIESIHELTADYFAVRSSANVEDGSTHSFAGIFDTQLFVRRENVPKAIDEVINSKRSDTLIAYCEVNGIDPASLSMRVIVQEMIDADVSGVAFGANPSKPWRKEIIASAVYGLGEGLVSGELHADTYTYSVRSNSWKYEISPETRKLKHTAGGLQYIERSSEEKDTSCLSERQLEQIRETLTQLEKAFGSPQDIEFCFKNEQFYLLQSRPITTLESNGKHTIWDNSNIIESYPGITLPFTFSFILNVYASTYRNLAHILGVPRKQIEANAEVFDEMLGHIKGRVYYHLINWYKALAMLPAYSINAGFMEKMMGVSEPLGVEFTLKNQPSKGMSVWYTLKTVVRILRLNRNLPDIKQRFTQRVNSVIDDYNQRDYSRQTRNETWNDFVQFKELLVVEWSPPLINDLLAMVYFGTLQKLCTNWLRDDSIHTRLIVGRYSVKSTQPALLLEKIVESIQSDEELNNSILSLSSDEIWQLCNEGKFGATGELILEYIAKFGDRSVGELKLENETFRQNPALLINIIKSYKQSANSQLLNHAPEEAPVPKLPYLKRRIFHYVLRKAAELVADRENLRFDRTRAFGVVRHLVYLTGEKLVEEGILSETRDIFYLTESEISEVVKGAMDAKNVETVLQKRRAEFKVFQSQELLPERIHQWGDILDLEMEPTVLPDQLKGIPCSPGIVEGYVRVLSNPNEVQSLEGDILVTTSTDPGWITIFRSASAILVERGSTLSHAAIVSREMGIPCIVGIHGITRVLTSGDVVRMDGQTGLVTQLRHDEA